VSKIRGIMDRVFKIGVIHKRVPEESTIFASPPLKREAESLPPERRWD